jgi:hypothetical protein
MTLLSCQFAKRTASHRRLRAANLTLGACIAMVGLAGVPSALAAPATNRDDAHSAGPSCNLASPSKVKSALGVAVSSPSATNNATITVCQFTTDPGLLVRFETKESASLFALGRKGFQTHGEPTKTVAGLGTEAYSSSIGGTNTIVVLKNTTELLVTASVPLAKVVALAKLILPSL